MTSAAPDTLQLKLWKAIAANHQSVSHDYAHTDRVLSYALQLQQIYGGDVDVLSAAVILHDLGRSDEERRHGISSIAASAEQAEVVLDRSGFPEPHRTSVLIAIAEHDQPSLRPTTIEGRILKDADFLAGFGAWGILRIAMWSGETGRPMNIVLDRLRDGMKRRMDSLEFPESRSIALRELSFVELFLSELARPAQVAANDPGLYIAIEGVSGSGKDTQARLLHQRLELESAGVSVTTVAEPSDAYRELRDAWKGAGGISAEFVTKQLLIADRFQQYTRVIRPVLEQGGIIVSIRSYLSTMVYQSVTPQEAAAIFFEHNWLRRPDVLLLLDIAPDVAFERCLRREKPPGQYETLDQLRDHRAKYREFTRVPLAGSIHVIDAGRSKDEVANDVWGAVIASGVVPRQTADNRHQDASES
jgi:uncharacterized protein